MSGVVEADATAARGYALRGGEDPMATLCRMALDLRYEDLPPEVVEHVKHTLLDSMAVTIGGSAMAGIPEIAALVKDKGGKPETVVAGEGVVGLGVGPDGWLYVGVEEGDAALTSSDGGKAAVRRTGAVFRCTPDGKKLVVGNSDGTAFVLDLP